MYIGVWLNISSEDPDCYDLDLLDIWKIRLRRRAVAEIKLSDTSHLGMEMTTIPETAGTERHLADVEAVGLNNGRHISLSRRSSTAVSTSYYQAYHPRFFMLTKVALIQ